MEDTPDDKQSDDASAILTDAGQATTVQTLELEDHPEHRRHAMIR